MTPIFSSWTFGPVPSSRQHISINFRFTWINLVLSAVETFAFLIFSRFHSDDNRNFVSRESSLEVILGDWWFEIWCLLPLFVNFLSAAFLLLILNDGFCCRESMTKLTMLNTQNMMVEEFDKVVVRQESDLL